VEGPAISGIHMTFSDGVCTVDVTSIRDFSNNAIISTL
jgi:hypothetical protein